MKIEMAEQMMASYLKNIEQCSFVETNWKPNPGQISGLTQNQIARTTTVMTAIKKELPSYDPFKSSMPIQFLSQTEIDVIGSKTDGNGQKHTYLVDTAFHEYGLQYKNTIDSVVKKLVRAWIIGDLFFAGTIVHVQFLSPKVTPSKKKTLLDCAEIILKTLQPYNLNVKIELFLDADFKPLLLDLIEMADEVKDDNDLFMRAIKLLRIFDLINDDSKKANGGQPFPAYVAAAKHNNRDVVLNTIDNLLKAGKITSNLEKQLTTVDYTKKEFGISSFPVLKEAQSITDSQNSRYYSQLVLINDTLYRVVSQWGAVSLKKLEEWARTV